MNMNISDKQLWLKELIAERVRKNPQFSLRAFARLVDVSPAVISRILSGQRNLTLNVATKISNALGLTTEEREKIYSLYVVADAVSEVNQEAVQENLQEVILEE